MILAATSVLAACALTGALWCVRSKSSPVPRTDADTLPPLLSAIDRRDIAGVEQLLKSGADPNVQAGGRSALYHAIFVDSAPILRSLITAGADVNAPDQFGPPLYAAAVFNRYQLADALLAAGADPNRQTADGTTPLAQMISNKVSPEYIRKFISIGADPNLPGPGKLVPLQIAARSGAPAQIDVLIASGASVAAEDGWKALYEAVNANRVDNLDCLLGHGVDPDALGPNGQTVFQRFASSQGRKQALARLIERGADPDRPYPNGQTPHDRAEATSNQEVLDLIETYRQKRNAKTVHQ
jgi:ankyrin repeat protein